MAKKPARNNQPWTYEDEKKLKTLFENNFSIREIGLVLKRTEASIRSKLRAPGLSPGAVNKKENPYKQPEASSDSKHRGEWLSWDGRTSSPGADSVDDAPDSPSDESEGFGGGSARTSSSGAHGSNGGLND